MKRARPLFIVFTLAALVVSSALVLPGEAKADTVGPLRSQSVTLYVSDPSDDIADEVCEALSNPAVDEVIVLVESLLEADGSEAALGLAPRSPYTIKNSRLSSTWTDGSDIIAVAEGGPGTRISISQSVRVSHSFSCSVSVGSSEVSTAVGFDVTDSVEVAVSGSYDVPTKIGQTPVYKSRLIANPVYNRYSYDVYLSSLYLNTGTADKAVGCSFRVQDLFHEGMG